MKNRFIVLICMFGVMLSLNVSNVRSQVIKGNGVITFLANKDNSKGLNSKFAQRFCIYEIDGKEYISLIAKVKKNVDLGFLKDYDCVLGSTFGQIITLRTNVNELERLCKDTHFLEIETSRKVGNQLLNNAVKDLQADSVWKGINLDTSYTGKGVMVGIADWGVDYTHPNFYDTLMQDYRIFASWDQKRKQGPAPSGYDYGTVLSSQNDLLTAGCDTTNIYDTGSHAAHVAGIIGGAGAGTKYRGVAPEVEFLFCIWRVDENSYLDGCRWMINTAKSQGKRLVINNSWGVYLFGYMDGTSLLDQAINNMVETDSVVFVVSAGNCGGDDFHIEADFDSLNFDTLRSEITFNFPEPYSKNYWGETVTLQGENDAPFSTKLEFYTHTWTKVGETPVISSNGGYVPEDFILRGNDSIIFRASARYPEDNRPLMDWEVRHTNYTNYNDHIVLCIMADSGTVHAWNVACLTTGVGNWGLTFSDAPYNPIDSNMLKGNHEYSVSEPALAEKVITVAAHQYNKHAGWRPTITSFSSRGPNLTHYLKPEVSAPGYQIVSSYSSFASEKSSSTDIVTFNGKDYQFAPMSGTSMSCPMVSGTAALVLQANPSLSAEEVKNIILSTAKTDDYTGECPNYTWGYGKVNAWKAVMMADSLSSGIDKIREDKIAIYPVPCDDYLFVGGIDYNAQIEIIDMMGRSVISEKYSGKEIKVGNLKAGVYLLKIKEKEATKDIKFIKK